MMYELFGKAIHDIESNVYILESLEFYVIWFIIGMSITWNGTYQIARMTFLTLFITFSSIEVDMMMEETDYFYYSSSPYTIRETINLARALFPTFV